MAQVATRGVTKPGVSRPPDMFSAEQLAAEATLAPTPIDDPYQLLKLFVTNAHYYRSAARVGQRDWLRFARTLRALLMHGEVR